MGVEKIPTKEQLKNMDVRELQAFIPVDNNAPGFGVTFSSVFEDYAKLNGQSYIILHFEKGKPESVLPDAANCTNEEYIKAIETLYERRGK